MQIDLINVERKTVDELHRQGHSSQEVLRKIELELDLEETRLKWRCTMRSLKKIVSHLYCTTLMR